MTWFEANNEMRKGKIITRERWHNLNWMLWLKQACDIQLSWCKDPILLQLVSKFGKENPDGTKYLPADEAICCFTGGHIITGFDVLESDKKAEDWIVVTFN